MSKKIIALIAAVVCMLCVFAGCNGKNTTVESKETVGNAVTANNGGFLAETEDYLFFINGNEIYTEDNTLGAVEKGALVRMAKADLGKASPEVEVLASKVVSTSDYSAGVYVFGDKVYFATPNNEENKVGTVLNDQIQFCSISAKDGGEINVFATAKGTEGNAAAYKFYQVDNKVYVAYAETTTNDDGTTVKAIKVVGEDGTNVATLEYENYVFEKGATADYIYFTKAVENEDLGMTESFNEVYSYKVGTEKADLVLYGAGSNRNTEAVKYENKGIQGVKFTLIAAENNYLYLSTVNVDTSVSTDTFYSFAEEGKLTATPEENYKVISGANKMNDGTTAAATIFASTSVFESPERIVYLDTTKGLCAYNYKNDDYAHLNGVEVVYYDDEVVTGTFAYAKGDAYYFHISGVYYEIANGESTKLSSVAFATDWYAPEVVTANGKEYIIGTLSADEYYDYIFAFETGADEEEVVDFVKYFGAGEKAKAMETLGLNEKDFDKLVKDNAETKYVDFISASGRANAKYVWANNAVAVYGAEEQAISDYIDTTYPGSEVKEEVKEEGCGSVAGAGMMLGGVLVALAGVAVSKKNR